MIKAAVLGKPIAHSLSPLVHGLIYKELGLTYSYGRFELDEKEAKNFIEDCFSSPDSGWSGFSLTMPLKEVGFELEMEVDSEARIAHSINTITPQGCFNTDVSGLRRVFLHEELKPTEVVILGNGATARSAIVAVQSFLELSYVSVFRRSERRDALLPDSLKFPLKLNHLSNLGTRHLDSDVLVISTLPASTQSEISERLAGFEGTLIDFSYSPWPSVFAGVVKGKVISGLPILVAQAIDQARIFTGLTFDENPLYKSVLLSTAATISSER